MPDAPASAPGVRSLPLALALTGGASSLLLTALNLSLCL
jgi:hypothetical protein